MNISIELHFMLTRKYIFKSIWIMWYNMKSGILWYFGEYKIGIILINLTWKCVYGSFNNSMISMMNVSEWRHAYKKSKGKCTSDYFLNFSLIYGSDNVQIMSHDAETYTMDVTMVVNFCYRVAYYCHRHIYLLTPARTQCRIGL